MNRRPDAFRDAPNTLASDDRADAVGSTSTPCQVQTIADPAPAADVPAPALPDFHRPETILAHPRFPAARKANVDTILGLYENDPPLNRLLIEVGRSHIFFHILCLHAAYDEGDRATWPTPRLLQESLVGFDLTSARRVEDVVAHFIAAGYVTGDVVPSDRRIRILVPTDKMVTHDLDWLRAFYTPLDVMFPDPGYAPPMRRDPAYRKAHRVVGRGMMAHGRHLTASNPPIMLFFGRDAGAMILFKLVQLAAGAPDLTSQRISFTDFGSRFGISRTHVRATLQDAARADLLHLSEQTVVMKPALIAAFDRFVADVMAGHDLMFRIATAP